jgi:ATP-dependent RNA/DNA helicase IGHMBP2
MFANRNLSAEQADIASFALNPSRPLAFIHGPPGTGKTTTLNAILRDAVGRGMKVNFYFMSYSSNRIKLLVTAPSNIAVDNLLQKYTENLSRSEKLRVCRLGIPFRVKDDRCIEFCLSVIMEKKEDVIM